MTEASPRRRRWSPGKIRATAWIAGTATAIVSGASLAASPMPATDRGQPVRRLDPARPRRVIERHVIRRVVVVDRAPVVAPASAPTIVVQAPLGGAPAPAPAPPPAPAPTSTGGS